MKDGRENVVGRKKRKWGEGGRKIIKRRLNEDERINTSEDLYKDGEKDWEKFENDKRENLLTELSPSSGAANCAAPLELPSFLWNLKVQYRVHKWTLS
jgi:hypothetical protein